MPGIQWVLEQDCPLETETPVHWVLQLEYVVWLQIQLDPCMSVLSLSLEFTSGRAGYPLHIPMLAGGFCCSVKITLLLPAELAEQLSNLLTGED